MDLKSKRLILFLKTLAVLIMVLTGLCGGYWSVVSFISFLDAKEGTEGYSYSIAIGTMAIIISGIPFLTAYALWWWTRKKEKQMASVGETLAKDQEK